jgi:hypothetical protein
MSDVNKTYLAMVLRELESCRSNHKSGQFIVPTKIRKKVVNGLNQGIPKNEFKYTCGFSYQQLNDWFKIHSKSNQKNNYVSPKILSVADSQSLDGLSIIITNSCITFNFGKN